MTANTLSNKERAKVASEVTGRNYTYWRIRGVLAVANDNGHHWEPDFVDPIGRSQALALVEYLADSGDSNYQLGAIRCVQRRDVESLMQLAHQMITKGKVND